MAELCQVSTNETFDGQSLVQFLRQPELTDNAAVFAEYDLGTRNKEYMIRQGDWKYCHYHEDIPQLFNLREDRGEMSNLAMESDYRQHREEVYERLCAWNAEVRQVVPSA